MTQATTIPPRIARQATAWLFGALAATLVAACGGGGGDDTTPVVMPTIASQPVDLSVTEGTSASFTVTANGTAPLAYQWASSPDGVTFTAIGTATAATFATGATTLAQSGTRYRVVVSNSAGSITSSAVRLTVTALVVPPSITVQPAAQVVTAPSTATFNVTATGSTLAYQWQLSTDGGATYAAVTGGPNAPTLSVTSTTTAQNGQRYRVVVSNTASSVTSTPALLTVNPTPVAPTFTSQPLSTTVVAGQSAGFTVVAVGTPAPSIQWGLNGTSLADGAQASGACSGTTVAGSGTATLTLTAVTAGCSGAVFTAVASNGTAPNATSNPATLTVHVPVPPTITVQPLSQSVITGATATFAVTATGPGLTYQWKRAGANIVGATTASYTTPAVSYVDSGAVYTVVVTNTDGVLTSNNATLSIALSADQQIFENLILGGGGSYEIRWNLPYSGPPSTGNVYAFTDFAIETQSPASHGPQTAAQSAPVNIATTLAPSNGGPFRVLKNGGILVVPVQNTSIASYVGSQVRIDYLASDNTTVAYSQLRSGFSLVPLSGNVKATTGDFAQYHNSFFSNTLILKGTTGWAAGSVFEKYSATNLGDRYGVFDCNIATTGAAPDPCSTTLSLTAALTAGLTSSSDGVTYHLSDGTISTVGGVQVWVATAPRSQTGALSSTLQYRIYFQLNGNVYTGALVRDGVLLGGSYYVPTPGVLIFLPFQLRMNKAARDSMAADMNI